MLREQAATPPNRRSEVGDRAKIPAATQIGASYAASGPGELRSAERERTATLTRAPL